MSTTSVTTSNNEEVSSPPNQQGADGAILDRLLPELMALPEKEIVQISVDIPLSVSMVFGNLPEIMKYRDQIVKAMPEFDVKLLDRLEDWTNALYEAHGRYLIATKPRNQLDMELSKGTQLRDTLLSDAKALVSRGLLEGEKLGELLGPVGHRNLSVDLNLLHHALKEAWPQIQGKSAVRLEEIEEALVASKNIIRLVGLRDEGTASVAEATEVRARAYTKFYVSYNGVRRAIAYLRWDEGDADKIAPSLHSGRSARRKGSDAPDEETQVPPDAGADKAGPAAHSASPHQAGLPAAPANTAASGTPESQPFMTPG